MCDLQPVVLNETEGALQISQKHWVVKDPMNWILLTKQEASKRDGTAAEKFRKTYHPTLAAAAKAALLSDPDPASQPTLAAAVKRMEEIAEGMVDAIKRSR
jgi:hypothetical protein